MGLKALVVEDDELLRRVVGRMLKTIGHQFQLASNAYEGLEIVQDFDFDFILSDIMMPGMNGDEFYVKLKEFNPAFANKMIFMSGGIHIEKTRKFIKSLPNPVLEKPFSFGDLQKAIAWAVNSSYDQESESRGSGPGCLESP